jgi:hypothetical protein
MQTLAMIAFFFLAYSVPCFSQSTNVPKNAPAKAEALPTADEIAAKCAKGSGGKEAWAKLSTLVMAGTAEIPAAGLTAKIEITAKAPNKIFEVFSFGDGQFVQKQAFDGRIGWKSDPQSGLKQLQGAELEQAKLESTFDTDVRMKEIYPDMKVIGRAKVGDRDAYTALVHEPGGKAVTFYFDAETGVRIAEDSEGPDASGNVEKSSEFFEDYRTVAGVRVPYQIRITSPSINLLIHVQEVKANVPVDDAVFAMPAATPAAPSSASKEESKPQNDSAGIDSGTFSQDVYVNRFLGIRYQAPPGWTPHGEETQKEIMAVGKSLVDQNTSTGKIVAARSDERTHQLLTLFQYPLGTPGVDNQLVQIMAEDVRFAPGIKSGRDYLLNVERVLKLMKTMPKFDEEPKEVTYGAKSMYCMNITTNMPSKTVYQAMVATVLKGYAVSFAFTSYSIEARDQLVRTIESLRFDDSEEVTKPH